MASIKQLDERRYKITVSNGYRPNGKKISKAKTIQVPPGVPKRGIGQYVAHAAEELERSFKTGYAEDGEMTFEEFASRWLKRQTKYAPSTIAAYRRMLEVVYPMIGGIRLNKLRPMALENMLSALRKRKHHGRLINASTAQRYLSEVSAVLSDAKRNETIEKNPARMLDLPTPQRTVQRIPTRSEEEKLLDALARTAYAGPHQYAVTFGAQNFREALAKKTSPALHHTVDPNTEICVTCGGTEAMMAAMMTICNPGDKVMIFSPFYENYGADAILSGAEPIYIPLVPPTYEIDISLIEKGFAEGAKALSLCNPSNPCGKVFRRDELEAIAALAIRYDAFVVTDEVYEHIVYAPAEHICMASLPGMFEHTITCNSLSKTYSITGWRLG